MQRSRCRSCNATILWVVMAGTGKRMPVDAEPHPEGNLTLYDDGTADVVSKDGLELARSVGPLHRSHFVTCPSAAAHRKPKGA